MSLPHTALFGRVATLLATVAFALVAAGAAGANPAAAPATLDDPVSRTTTIGATPAGPARPAPPARHTLETAAQRRALLRQHTLDRARRRIEQAETEAVYRYVPTPRPGHLEGAAR